jgi:ubiquinone biosynthesis protein COQ9
MAEQRLRLRDELLEAMLPHVPFDGWTPAALRHAAEDIGIDRDTARDAFAGGPAEMVEHFSDWSDRRMLEELEAENLASMGVTARVRTAVETRFRQAEPHREAVQRSVAFLTMPQNVLLGGRLLYRTVDAIWHAAGDTATDWNFYSKRGLLAGVFSSTVLYWLNDRSEGFADTLDFLDRRLRDVANFGKATSKFKERFKGLPRRYRPYRR